MAAASAQAHAQPQTQQQQVPQTQQQVQPQTTQQPQVLRNVQPQASNVPIPQHAPMPVQQVVTTPSSMLQVPIQITLPGNSTTGDGKPKVLSIQVPASAIQANQLHTILTGPIITAAMGFPENVASRLLQQHVDKTLQGQAALTPIEINQPLQVIQSTNNVQQQLPVQNQVNIFNCLVIKIN